MLISQQLQEAIVSNIVEDVSKTLNNLAKRNNGLWKSEKQARFILQQLKMKVFKDRAAEAWARQHKYKGHAFSHVRVDPRFGRRDPTKIRYIGNVYVVDDGGVVAKGRLKITHPKKGEGFSFHVEWGTVKVEFERKKIPTISVDVDAELRAKVEKNMPDINLIKSIPGWEHKDILVSFVRQLEAGRTLTPPQMGIVQKMAPQGTVSLNKEEWKEAWEKYKKLVGSVVLPALKDFFVDFERSQEKKWKELEGQGQEGKRKMMYMRKPDVEGKKVAFNAAIQRMNSKAEIGSAPGVNASWIDTRVLDILEDAAGRNVWAGVYTNPSVELKQQMERVIKTKKPSKKGLKVVAWVQHVVDRLGNTSRSKMDGIVKKYHAD